MGQTQNTGHLLIVNKCEADTLIHPSFSSISTYSAQYVSSNIVQIRMSADSKTQKLIQHKVLIPNSQTYMAWIQELEQEYSVHDPSQQKYIDCTNIMLPQKVEYQHREVCGSAGQLAIYYPYYPYNLTYLISQRYTLIQQNRKSQKISHPSVSFTEEQMWILVASLAHAFSQLHQHDRKIQIIHPEHIYLCLHQQSRAKDHFIHMGAARNKSNNQISRIKSVKIGTKLTYISNLHISQKMGEQRQREISLRSTQKSSLKEKLASMKKNNRSYEKENQTDYGVQWEQNQIGKILLTALSLRICELNPQYNLNTPSQQFFKNFNAGNTWGYSQSLITIVLSLNQWVKEWNNEILNCKEISELLRTKSNLDKGNISMIIDEDTVILPTIEDIRLQCFKRKMKQQFNSLQDQRQIFTTIESQQVENKESPMPVTHSMIKQNQQETVGPTSNEDNWYEINTETNLITSPQVQSVPTLQKMRRISIVQISKPKQ